MALTADLLSNLRATSNEFVANNKQPEIDKILASFEQHADGAAKKGRYSCSLTFPKKLDFETTPADVHTALIDAGFSVDGSALVGETVTVSWSKAKP